MAIAIFVVVVIIALELAGLLMKADESQDLLTQLVNGNAQIIGLLKQIVPAQPPKQAVALKVTLGSPVDE